MRILALSDLHFGKKKAGWETFAEDRVAAAIKAAKKYKPDVFYFGGDLADQGPEGDKLFYFRRGLEALDEIPVEKRVFVCGNHDLEFLEGESVFEYPHLLQEAVSEYGFHVIDREPYVFDRNIAFVGNIGMHDGSLWNEPSAVDPDWPSTRKQILEADTHYWLRTMSGFKDTTAGEVSSRQFHEWCKDRLIEDWDRAAFRYPKAVVCTHYTPGPQFVVDGSAKYEYLNWYMGFDGNSAYSQKHSTGIYRSGHTVLGLCGHTHRDHQALIGTTWVRNVSGPMQPSILDV